VARAHRNPTVLERYAKAWHAGATRVELGATREPGDPRLRALLQRRRRANGADTVPTAPTPC